jgi:hypothetical protein
MRSAFAQLGAGAQALLQAVRIFYPAQHSACCQKLEHRVESNKFNN